MNALLEGSSSTVRVGSEKRRIPRKETAVCVWMQFRRDPSVRGTTTVDLSPDGARFNAPHPVRPGEQVMLYLQLEPVAYTIECKGKVCWSQPQDSGVTSFGVRFLDLREDEEENLRKTLERRPGR